MCICKGGACLFARCAASDTSSSADAFGSLDDWQPQGFVCEHGRGMATGGTAGRFWRVRPGVLGMRVAGLVRKEAATSIPEVRARVWPHRCQLRYLGSCERALSAKSEELLV